MLLSSGIKQDVLI